MLELIGNMGLQLSKVYINRFITAAEVGPTGADQLTALLRLYVVALDGIAALATFLEASQPGVFSRVGAGKLHLSGKLVLRTQPEE